MSRDVVFSFFLVDWHGARRRGSGFAQDRLFERLLVDERVGRLVVGNPYRSLAAAVARRRRLEDVASGRVTMATPTRLARRDPVGTRALRRTYDRYDTVLARAARTAGLDGANVVTTNPLVAGLCPLEWARTVTYYATDDWPAHHAYARWRSAFTSAISEIAARGRRVCAVSSTIGDRIGSSGPTIVVPNGVCASEWLAPGPAPEWFRRLPGPRLLYAGTLDRRIDLRLVEATARRLPRASITFLGPVVDDQHVARLAEVPGVTIRPEVSRATLAAVMSSADVCLLPHSVTPLTEAMSPLKVYEYLAAGRPVAAVDLPALREIGDRVMLAAPDGFADAVVAAVEAGPAPEDERRRFVHENSWDRRHDQILAFSLA